MKKLKTIIATIGLGIVAGVALAELPSLVISTTNVLVTSVIPVDVVTTNQISQTVTNLVSRKTVSPLIITEQQMNTIIAALQTQGVNASEQIYASNLSSVTVLLIGGTNGAPVSFKTQIRLRK